MKIYIASDHAGFELKNQLISYLEENGIAVFDKGPFEYKKDDDYPDWISLVAEEVGKNPNEARGIVIGMSGQGEALTANKFKNVRAGVLYKYDEEIVRLMREHNDVNVLSLGANFLSPEEAEKAVDIFIDTEFSNDERHVRRIKKITKIENEMGQL